MRRRTADVPSRPRAVAVPAGASTAGFRFRSTGSDNGYRTIDGVTSTPS
ncbi:hypothetical protein ACFXHD_20990 [Streptomyces hydrogenans]